MMLSFQVIGWSFWEIIFGDEVISFLGDRGIIFGDKQTHQCLTLPGQFDKFPSSTEI